VSRNHRTGQSGKGRPTPPRPNRGPKGRSTPSRSSTSVRGARKGPVYRQRRYPALPTALKLALALVWLAALAATIRLVEPWTGRVGVMIVVTMVLVLFVVLVFNPSRRSGRR
jgi:hypothetical protein